MAEATKPAEVEGEVAVAVDVNADANVETADPPATEAVEDKANEPEVEVEDKSTNKPTDNPTTAENGTDEGEGEAGVAAADDDKPSIFKPPPGMLRVTGPRQQKKFVKSDPASLAETDDPREIRKQVCPLSTP